MSSMSTIDCPVKFYASANQSYRTSFDKIVDKAINKILCNSTLAINLAKTCRLSDRSYQSSFQYTYTYIYNHTQARIILTFINASAELDLFDLIGFDKTLFFVSGLIEKWTRQEISLIFWGQLSVENFKFTNISRK